MKFITHWLFIACAWIVISTIGFSLYIKLDWENTLQQYEKDFKEYKLEKQSFKMMFRRAPSPIYMWGYKYVSEQTKKAFNEKEFKCLKDETTCTPEQRTQLCIKLKTFPNISDCKSIEQMRVEFIKLNRYMDSKFPPKKPTFESYLDTHKIRHIIFSLVVAIPPLLILLYKLTFNNKKQSA